MSNLAETKKCTNCKIDILSNNYTIHCLHCIKNIYLCDKCEQPVNHSKKSYHDEINHVVVNCPNCNRELEKYLLGDHLENDCPYRKIKCSICDIEVAATDLSEHENYCGSRTEKCSECDLFVMLKYKSLHIDSNHTFIKLSDEPGPSPSWQNGKRSLYNFLPDLSSKTVKFVADHKRSSKEFSRKSKNLELNKSNDDSPQYGAVSRNFDSVFEKKDKVDHAVNNLSKNKDIKSSSRKIVDEWPALTSLGLLQISEEKENNPTRPEAEDSDLTYAIQLSQELNSHIWFKDSNTKDEALKNCFQLTENNLSAEKVIQKNTFDKNIEKETAQLKVNFNKNDLDNQNEECEVNLPCEFCGSLIVYNEFILHQSRCSLNWTEPYIRRSTRHKVPYFDEIDEANLEKKIPCGICNKVFKSSLLESHQLHCRRNPMKVEKNQDKGCSSRNVRTKNMKSELGIQNGVESNSPALNRAGTHSEWLSEFSKSTAGKKDLKNNFNISETGSSNKAVKASKKSRRAPSPPRR